jgi:uncharacterized protein YjiS (DUF1127 family)
MDDADPTVPAHLRFALGEAAELEFEFATDGFWPDHDDERAAWRDRALRAARAIDHWEANTCTREELAKLADVAAHELGDIAARELGEAGDVTGLRSSLIRDLVRFREAMAGEPSEKERNEPA